MVESSAAGSESFARAVKLHRSGRLEEAASLYRAVAAAPSPFAASALINHGAILDQQGLHEQAVADYRQALALTGADPLAFNNMGNSLLKLGRFAEASGAFRQAVALAPDCLEARIGLGAALQRQGDAVGAIACFRETLQMDPGCAEAHWNLALALLISGEFREGWREYLWRWRRDSFTSPKRDFRQPEWDGSPLHGRRILVHAEQGLGDTIQFARYLPLLSAAGGTVIAECQSAALRPLLQRISGVSSVHLMGELLPPFDLQVPLLSLPHLFGTTLENVPDRIPYLSVDPERLALWSQRVAGDGDFKVGLVWAGKPVPDPFRSCTLQDLAPLGSIPGVTLYSLQLPAGKAAAQPHLDLVDLTCHINDFADTAAILSHLDLVISVDTSVAHLAGALGKPVWLLLPKAGDYRWLLWREDSPWYPTMRIFRQESQGEWGSVLQRVCRELEEASGRFLESSAQSQPLNGRRLYLCGASLAAQGRHAEAVPRFSKAAQLVPGSWEPHYSMGQSLQFMGLLPEARGSLESALTLNGDAAFIHEALGIVTQMQGDLDGAIQAYRKALALDPSLVKSRYNLATALREKGLFREALAGFEEVIALAPGHADAHWNLALLLLVTGELARGWREFHWRFSKTELPPARRWQGHPAWDGSTLDGGTILLHAEQGLGDTLQFVRYAPMVAARGGRVLVEVQSPSLCGIVSRVTGVSGVVATDAASPEFDLQASLLDLPGLFGTELNSIPGQPYLRQDAALLAQAAELMPRGASFRVGIVWSGNPAHTNDARRSLSLQRLAPLRDLQGVTWFSLQLPEKALEREPELPFAITDLSGCIEDFSDTAALAAQLDLVLTVDTAVAHLCGGLGLPVWVMLPYVPDWRWLLEREDSPWYPTMRLFRQEAPDDWRSVVLRVRAALQQEIAGKKGRGQGGATGSGMGHHKERGLALSEEGRYLEAAAEFRQAVASSPANAELLNDLGCALDSAGQQQEAVLAYRKGLALKPDFMPLHYNMGNSLKSLGRAAEACESYRRALALDPSLPQGWHNLALALQDLGELDQAKQALERALLLRPDYLEARHNLGELQHRRGDLDAALDCFREVLVRNPRHLPSWNALGIALHAQERLDEAVDCYLKALSIDPDYLHALNNLGAASKGIGDLDRAVRCYHRVLSLDPDYADAHWNLSLVQLLKGDYLAGWRGYEWRFRKMDPVRELTFPQPRWDGSPLDGKTILLTAEQGFGDTIQFVRYATVLAGMGGVVLVQCQAKPVAPVVATVPGVARVLVRGEALPHFDTHAPVMSLPMLCGTTLATVPAQTPYLSADPELVELWRSRVNGKGVRVGLVWAGRKSYKDDGKRSLNLNLFAPLAAVAGVSLYSLQVGEGSEQAAVPPAGMELSHLGDRVESFADTSAIIEHLDLVISADTAVAHLAGALGKPVWVLLPKSCDWRWLLDREDSPWYPTARLFRQSRRGDWREVLERVAAALAALAQATATRGTAGLLP